MSKGMLLLSCCAPCSCAVIKHLSEQKKPFTVVFYNPNIRPVEEYQKRCAENKKVCAHYGVPFVELEYDPQHWCQLTQGLEHEPERGKRCDVCFEMRLRRIAKYAKENHFDSVSSVLGVSKYKDFDQVNRAAERAFQESAIPYEAINWRKGGLEQLRQALQKELNLYAQNYCGCKPR